MLDKEMIELLLRRLAEHRNTLASLLYQVAILTEPYATPGQLHGIAEARKHIAHIKETLRDAGVWVDDHPDDDAPPTLPRLPVDATQLATDQTSLDAMPLDVIPDPASLPPGSYMHLHRNPLFVGREADLMQLAAAFRRDEKVIVTTGIGGIGKTQLASEFAHRYGQYFAGGVFWISFADPANIGVEIAACGRMGALELYRDADRLTLEEQVERVYAAWAQELPRLLIFDNCDDQETRSAEALLSEYLPRSGGCRVLVTSRRADWSKVSGVKSIPLDVLDRADSLALLHKHRPELAADDRSLNLIAHELGDLPLALHLAGSYLETNRDSSVFGDPAGFMKELRDQRLLDHEALQGVDATASPTNHALHVARTFVLSYRWLTDSDPVDNEALLLLARAACFAPGESIPYTSILEIFALRTDDRPRLRLFERASRRLVALGLINEEAGALRLHRLLALFTQKVIGERFSAAQLFVEQALLMALRRANDGGEVASLLPLQVHLRFVTQRALQRRDELASDLAFELDRYLSLIGDWQGALGYEEQALAIRRAVLAPDHWKIAQSLNSRGLLFFALGRCDDARQDYEQALAILGQTTAHLQLLAHIYGNQGSVWVALDDMDSAYTSIQLSLALREQAFGKIHADTAGSYSDLATWHFFNEDYDRARQLYEESLAIFQQVHPQNHRDTAQALQNLGEVFFVQGEYATARQRFEEALKMRERTLSTWHEDIAYTLHHLALCCHVQGETALACAHMRRAVEIRQKSLGAEHNSTRESSAKLQEWGCDDPRLDLPGAT